MISVVLPCFNEQDVLPLTYQRLTEAARDWGDAVEIVFVDDGSRDDTWQIIAGLARRDPRVRGVRLSRNFGHQAAMGAGLERARGDAVVVLDADLQDPPSLVNEMLAQWRAGYDVVYAQRNRRLGESWFKRVTGSLFYRLLDKLNTASIPRDTGDFALLDARVAKLLVGFKEHAVFWRGLRSWSGFKHVAVRFDRPGRAAGETKYTLRKLVRLASDGLLSFSDLPLRTALYAGAASLALTAVAALVSIICWSTGLIAGSLSPMALGLFFLGSVQLLCLGIVGEYLNRIYDEVRNRPRWIVESAVGELSSLDAALQSSPRRLVG